MRSLTTKPLLGGLCVALSLLFAPAPPARADIDVSIGINLGFHVPIYPRLALIRGYPVYYAPNLHLNYFFYDGWYWVFHNDHWYVSGWYNGPWRWVEPEYVPWFVLRIPVRYYRRPPTYFYGWRPDAPPRWGDRWGRDWEDRHRDWDRWDRRYAPRPAPLPDYQRNYSGPRYPGDVQRQERIRSDRYRYQPRDDTPRQFRPERQESPRQERPDEWRRPAQPAPQPMPRPQPQRDDRPGMDDRDRMNAPQPRGPMPQQVVPDEPRRQRDDRPGADNRERLNAPQPRGPMPQVVPGEPRGQSAPRIEQRERERERADMPAQRRPPETLPQRERSQRQEEWREQRRPDDEPRRRD